MHFTCFLISGLLSLCSLSTVSAVSEEQRQQPLQSPEQSNGPFDASFDSFVELMLQLFHVPGLSIAVVDNGTVFSKGYGFSTLDPPQNATADTQYYTGSTTKAFVAAAAAMLVHNDEKYPGVRWNSRINDFIREDFVLEDEYATSHLTIEDALSHRTGLPRHDSMYGQGNETLKSILQRIRYLPLTAEPRTKWQYCNIMFGVMTDLIETLTEAQLETFLEENIWRPLGMASTTWTNPDLDRLARGYYWNPNQQKYVPEPYVYLLPVSGAGATISSVNDYTLWIKAWLEAPFEQNDTSPITKRIHNDLWSARSIIAADLTPDFSLGMILPPLYGLAWMMTNFGNQPLISHGGSVTGFGTELFILPNSNYGVVTMGNTMGSSNAVGAVIAARLLAKKVGGGGAKPDSTLLTLENLPKPHLKTSISWIHDQSTASGLRALLEQVNRSALRESLAELAGLYSHPAYGQINLTIAGIQDDSVKELEFLLYPRTWPLKARLVHNTGALFVVHLYFAHGTGDIPSGKGIVWEDVGESAAVFELDPFSGKVESMGIALEGEMVTAAVERGPGHWREALLWFERV